MGDLEHSPINVDHEVLKGFVERLFNVEDNFANVKAEYADSKKDLKAEIKSRTDETGITFAQVQGLVKIRMNEQQAIDDQIEQEANMTLYEQVFGFATPAPAAEDDDEDPLG